MDRIKIYKPPDGPAQAAEFIEGLEPKLRDKVVRQTLYLSRTSLLELKEPHYKHFSIEKYQSLYELREKGRVVVRIIFTPCPNGDYGQPQHQRGYRPQRGYPDGHRDQHPQGHLDHHETGCCDPKASGKR